MTANAEGEDKAHGGEGKRGKTKNTQTTGKEKKMLDAGTRRTLYLPPHSHTHTHWKSYLLSNRRHDARLKGSRVSVCVCASLCVCVGWSAECGEERGKRCEDAPIDTPTHPHTHTTRYDSGSQIGQTVRAQGGAGVGGWGGDFEAGTRARLLERRSGSFLTHKGTRRGRTHPPARTKLRVKKNKQTHTHTHTTLSHTPTHVDNTREQLRGKRGLR